MRGAKMATSETAKLTFMGKTKQGHEMFEGAQGTFWLRKIVVG